MKFEYFRFLLTPVKEPQLPLHGKIDRDDLIAEIFSKNKTHIFKSRKANYGITIDFIKDGVARGRVGKKTTKKLRSSPEEGFTVKDAEDWPGSTIVINLNDEKETGKLREAGQIIAISVNKSAIQSSKKCLRAFAEKINEEIVNKGFFFTINPIPTEKTKFWAIAKKYKGQIQKVTLTYTPPNILQLGSTLEDDLREDNKVFNTTKTQVVFENESGDLDLPEANSFLNQSADYIDLGGGTYKFNLKNGKTTLTSENGIKTETFEGVELSLEANDEKEIQDALKLILGVEND